MKNLTHWTALIDFKIACCLALDWRTKMNSLVLMAVTLQNSSHPRVTRAYALLIDSKRTTLWSALTSFPSLKNQAQLFNSSDYHWIPTKISLKVKITTTVWRLNRTRLLTFQGWWTVTTWVLHLHRFLMPHRTCFHQTEFTKWVNSIPTLLNIPNNSWLHHHPMKWKKSLWRISRQL